MSRFFLIAVLAGLLLIGVAMVILGAFPPQPAQHPVQHTLPNDRFQGR